MDGNGRWAQRRGLPRLMGHRAGTENIRRIVRACVDQGVAHLTLYAFSTENWSRPSPEVNGLMRILAEFIDRETENLRQEGARIRHLGRLHEISPDLVRRIEFAQHQTRENTKITLAVAFNYGGRADIVDAARAIIAEHGTPDAITEERLAAHLSTAGMPDPDLIIRTGGEWRLSNFLIWQAAYSEYWSTPVFWPEFGPDQLAEAIGDYGRRQRRFGGLIDDQ